MLIREGRKNSYLAGGVLQIILGLLLGFLFMPTMLAAFGVDVGGWSEMVEGIVSSDAAPVLFAMTNFLALAMLLINFLALFARRSLSSTFFKLSSLLTIFLLAVVGLRFGIAQISGEMPAFLDFLTEEGLRWALIVSSAVCLILGFVFQFSFSRNNPNKATTYQMAKALLWLWFAIFNFLILPSSTSEILVALFAYPAFFAWYFIIMGIWQLFSSARLIDPSQGSAFGTYPTYPNYGPQPQYPPAPPQQYGQHPYAPPYPPYPNQYYGPRQGMSSEDKTKMATSGDKKESVASAVNRPTGARGTTPNVQQTGSGRAGTTPNVQRTSAGTSVDTKRTAPMRPTAPVAKPTEPKSVKTEQTQAVKPHPKMPAKLPPKLPQGLPQKLPPKLAEKKGFIKPNDPSEKEESDKETDK